MNMMRYLIPIFFVTFFSCRTQEDAVNSEQTGTVSGSYPDRIMLTIPGDPARSRAVSWRTAFEISNPVGQIVVQHPSPYLDKDAVTVKGHSAPWDKESKDAMGHKVAFDNLQPGTRYAYRVGDGKHWSEWVQFTTSYDKPERFGFLYFGDLQNEIKNYCSRVLRQAYTHFPDAEFMILAGDLVGRSYDHLWHDFFYAGGWIFGMLPSVPTPGNHEYFKDESGKRYLGNQWQQIFTLPGNGPSEKFTNRVYYMDYQGVRFISIDSPAMEQNPEDAVLILSWLDQTLEENPYKWAVVFTHYPVYSCSQGRDKDSYRDGLKPVLEKHGVDLVLQGHDHTYCRGRNLPMVGSGCVNPPVYVVSVAGAKMYGLSTSLWSDRFGSELQLYQYITIDNNKLNFECYTVTGELYDAFSLTKDDSGINDYQEAAIVKSIPVSVSIPEARKNAYSEEDLKTYEQKVK